MAPRSPSPAVLVSVVCGLAAPAAAAVVHGQAFTVAGEVYDGDRADPQNLHFHTIRQPPGKAEVGGLLGFEEIRGLAEFELASLAAAPGETIELSFRVWNDGGLYNFEDEESNGDDNDRPFVGLIRLLAYEGNNRADLSDYTAAAFAEMPAIDTRSLVEGIRLRLDVTELLASALGEGLPSLGLRLETLGPPPDSAGFVFDDFRLETQVVPEATSGLLLAAGLTLALRRRRLSA